MLQLERRRLGPHRLGHGPCTGVVVECELRGQQIDARARQAVLVASALQHLDQLGTRARRVLGVAGGEFGVDEIAARQRGIAPALDVQGEQAAPAGKRRGQVAGHARAPLRGLGAPQQALGGQDESCNVSASFNSVRAAAGSPHCAAALAARHNAW
jgi:hypothetical protein